MEIVPQLITDEAADLIALHAAAVDLVEEAVQAGDFALARVRMAEADRLGGRVLQIAGSLRLS